MTVIDPNSKPPSASAGVDTASVTQHMTSRQAAAGDFATRLRSGLITGVQGGLSMASAVLSVNGPNVITQAMNRASGALSAGVGADGVGQLQGPSTLAGMSDNHPSYADAQASPSVAVMASNNSAVLGQKPTFMSILQDSGTGGPNFGATGGVSASMSVKSNETAASGPAAGHAAGITTAAGFSGEGLGLGAMGVSVSGLSSSSALGAGANTVPGSGLASAGSMLTGTAAGGGDPIASGASAGGSGSQAQLFQATQGMQEMQMSFNMQYLQLQNSMQNDNRQFTMVSNIMKTKHDTVKNTISNIH